LQTPEPSAFHQPAGTVPDGHTFSPYIEQQNSVYPSQHRSPQLQLWPEQEQMAACAVTGRNMKASGATVSAVAA
jgi:hypothetical protein